ncbi:MAG: hypothetical protein CMP50_01315 [Flavobacteriales bacterium]|nr:hypothetical protein [Flavobacteriales bacterium]
MICLNDLINFKCNKREILTDFIILLSPYAPFISEEIWECLGNDNSITNAKWPVLNQNYIQEEFITYPISFNGKMRFTLNLSINLSKPDIEQAVIQHPKTVNYLNNQNIKKIIIIPNKIVNIVF